MATSTIKLNGTTLMTVSDTTATDADVASGEYFYAADGTKTLGTASGGGGAGLPEVSSADNGDVLMVVDGEWDKADKGWNASAIQLFSESVTTIDAGGYSSAYMNYAQSITAPTLYVTFNGTDYTCPNIGGEYGAPWGGNSYDWSTYPFNIYNDSNGNMLSTQNAGTYTISASAEGITTTTNFNKAAQKAVGGGIFQITEGTTTFQDVFDAMELGKICITSFSNAGYGYARTYYALYADVNNNRVMFAQYNALDKKVDVITYAASSANDPLYAQ